MTNFDFSSNMQSPDYTQILQAIRERSQVQNPLNAALQGLNTAFPQILQRQKQQQQKQQWAGAIDKMVSQNPQMASYAETFKQDPSLMGQILPGMMKPQKTWQPIPGQISKTGHSLYLDPYSGEEREGKLDVVPTGGSQMAAIREKQFGLQDLPSNQSPNTAGGAAYQVKIAARQGKNLIAKSGSAQRTALASGDLARAVLRASPTEDAMHNANFSDNLVTRWSTLKQKLTADPNSVQNPQIRREIYSIFDEMDKSATPFIKNQLDDMESMGFKIPPDVRKRQMGETLPEIPFIELGGQTGLPNSNSNAGWDAAKSKRYEEWKKTNGY